MLSQDISGSLTSYPFSGGREEEPREGMYIGRQCFVTCMLNLKDIQVVHASVSPFDLFHFYISRKKAADKWNLKSLTEQAEHTQGYALYQTPGNMILNSK